MNPTALFLWAAAHLAGQSGPMTMDQAIEAALEHAFSIRLAEVDISKSEQVTRQLRTALGPTLSAQGTYTRFDRATTSNFGSDSVVISPIDQKKVDLTLSMPIDISGTKRLAISANKKLTQAGRETLEAQINTVKGSVRTAYLNVLKARDLVSVRKEAVALREATVKNARLGLEQGSLAKVDVVQAETQLAAAQGELIIAQNQYGLAKKALNSVIGRPVETEFEVAEVQVGERPLTQKLEGLQETAIGTRAEVRSLKTTLDAYDTSLKAAKRLLLPDVRLNVVHSRNIDAGGFGARKESTTGVAVVSFPIYDGGNVSYQVGQYKEDQARVRVLLEQTLLGVSFEVQQAMANHADALARMTIATEAVRLSEEALRVIQVKYTEGEAIQIEVDRAQTDLTTAKTNLVIAKYDVLSAYAQLQKAVGADDLGAKAEGANS